jgi:hypothetical protein
MMAASTHCARWPRVGRSSSKGSNSMRCVVHCSKEPWPTTSARAADAQAGRIPNERLYGVRLSEVHMWRLIGTSGFSSQKPERRAIERAESAVLAWKRKTWPAFNRPPSGD